LTGPVALIGYAHPSYAASLAEFGQPRLLPRSDGWVLERNIPDTDLHDVMGCYPLFVCRDWSGLEADLEHTDAWVCLSMVTDPFGAYDEAYLRRCFGDLVVPFKRHFVTDLSRPIETTVSHHHRHYARKALERVSVERCSEPARFLEEWTALYGHLIARHDLNGIKAFSKTAFAVQLGIPGLVMLRATHEGQTVGAHLWYRQGEVMYSHLAAVSAAGYQLMASYALHWFALQTFAGEARWLNFGAGSGQVDDDLGGLTKFKRGWATGARTAYFCGRIFHREQYHQILATRRSPASDYFPAYRHGEFT
jgi:Acetyltransferase (GNAT) domain